MSTTIETVTITRPLKLIALLCGTFVIILLVLALCSTEWLIAAGWRQGLFLHCIEEGAPQPLPFNMKKPAGCYQTEDRAYLQATSTLFILAFLSDVFGVVSTAVGLKMRLQQNKNQWYKLAVVSLTIALGLLLVALIVYPTCFAAELSTSNRTVWKFGWAYGVGWGSVIFLFGAITLLMLDKESEQIYYREREIVQYNTAQV
ncbi:PREDICTED: transmembrane protein 47-like [Nicrophorus vespilloides]|uniref:Transmembrane protein 47-like n=1 Tax=Nicrophorus vespilloides TaxID=110193 RepID=A0ABM1M8A0_NICVS|nr:PREDICTED: transmembrane protein 47-like [Nicrophorus vespilloides]